MNEGKVEYRRSGHRKVPTSRISYRQQRVIVQKIGEVYRDDVKRIELATITPMASSQELENCVAYVRSIDRNIDDCNPETRLIIRREFLERPPDKWYLAYMKERHYYTARQRAVAEFLSCLNLWTVVK